MLQLFDRQKKKIGLIKEAAAISVEGVLSTGDKTLKFEYPLNGDRIEDIVCECYIRTKTDEFVLKEIVPLTSKKKYTATLNLEELEGKVFETNFRMTMSTFEDVMSVVLEETGWSVALCEVRKKRTIAKEAGSSALDVIRQCLNTYKIEIKYDTLHKKIYAYEHIGSDRGAYFMEDLNLKKLKVTENSYSFYTRILPIGKNGLRIGSVNGGKDYLEDYTYSQKVKTYVWIDERYTVPESMMEDAAYKLAEMARVYTTYEAEVKNLAANSETYKRILDFGLGDTVTLVSKSEKRKEKQRIAKLTEYPLEEDKNTCELSSLKQTFIDLQQEESEAQTDSFTATVEGGTAAANEYSDQLFAMLSDEIDVIDEKATSAETTVNLMSSQVNKLSEQVKALSTTVEGSGESSAQIQETLAGLVETVNGLDTAIKEIQQTDKGMDAKLDALASDHETLRQLITELTEQADAQHEAITQAISSVAQQNDEQGAKLDQVKEQQQTNAGTLQSVSEGVTAVEARAKAIEEEVVLHTEQLGKMPTLEEKLNQIITLLTPTDPDPTEPTDPDPTNPTDPDPTNPTDPDPTNPTDPDPTNPTEPTDPDPTNPTEPTDPGTTEGEGGQTETTE